MQGQVLLFDLGGVLIKLRIAESLTQMRGRPFVWQELRDIWLANPVLQAFERGATDRDTFAREFIHDFELDVTPEAFLTECATWPVGFFDGALEMLASLRKTHTIACLSNTNELHWQQLWVDQFDYAFGSHLIGKVKPEPAAFAHVADAICVTPGQITFFDDALTNVEAARDFGFDAHQTDGFASLTKTMRMLGYLEAY